MFLNLFDEMKSAKIPVSLREYLTFLEALTAGVAIFDVNDFYYLARTSLVKDERHIDRFDQVFSHVFKGLEAIEMEEVFKKIEIPNEWIKKLAEKTLSKEEMEKINSLGSFEKLMETLKKRLEEQKDRHQGGNKWIGTAGTSPFGAYGYNPEGIRIGQHESRHKRAVKVWDKREFKNFDSDIELGTRGMKIALKRLRRWARDGADEELATRLSLFDDEPDINDWFEVALGAAMITMGLHQLFNPGGLFEVGVMQWLGAAVVASGLILLGHGIKDMLLKEVRSSIIRLDMDDDASSIDYGLIRDVLLHPDKYQQLLYDAYELAYADGILTEAERNELSALARVLQVPERSAARMATRAAIESALEDNHVSEAEMDLIVGAARPLGLSDAQLARIVEALQDHDLDPEERAMLDEMLATIPDEEEE